jgi:flagella basal body P-ring formation protein FlgA
MGMSEVSSLEGELQIELLPLPEVVVATVALNRGDVIAVRDLELKTIARTAYRPEYYSQIEDLIGKEVTRGLSAGRPLVAADVSVPLIIRRGELVELRVVGAGIVVTTNAKALASAAVGEAVLVETESPRKRVSGRAVRAGVVEIISRPPGMNEDENDVKN